MKKKGFTLIELLAVIVILAVIALIAVPLVTKLIQSSKEDAAKESAKLIISEAKLAYQSAYMVEGKEPTLAKVEEYFKADGVTLENHIATDKFGNSCVFSNENSSFKVTCTNNNYSTIEEETTGTMTTSDNNTGGTIVSSSEEIPTTVGGTMCVTLDGFTTTNDHTAQGCTEGQFLLRLSNTSECTNGETSETACGKVLEFVDLILERQMNPYTNGVTTTGNGNIGGWASSELRTYVNDTLYNALPSDLKSQIIDTTVVSSHGSNDSSNFTSTDKLYLLSSEEIYGTSFASLNTGTFTSSSDTSYGTSRQLDYYYNESVTINNNSAAIKYLNGTSAYWRLRSALSDYNHSFALVDNGGYWGFAAYSSDPIGISPAFRIQ